MNNELYYIFRMTFVNVLPYDGEFNKDYLSPATIEVHDIVAHDIYDARKQLRSYLDDTGVNIGNFSIIDECVINPPEDDYQMGTPENYMFYHHKDAKEHIRTPYRIC